MHRACMCRSVSVKLVNVAYYGQKWQWHGLFLFATVLYATPQEEKRETRKTSRRWYAREGKGNKISCKFPGILLSRGYYDSLVGLQVRYPTKAADNSGGDVSNVANKTANVCRETCWTENPIFSGLCFFEDLSVYLHPGVVAENVIGDGFRDLGFFAWEIC